MTQFKGDAMRCMSYLTTLVDLKILLNTLNIKDRTGVLLWSKITAVTPSSAQQKYQRNGEKILSTAESAKEAL